MSAVNEWGCPSCGGLFVVTDQQAATHYRLCAPEDDDAGCDCGNCDANGCPDLSPAVSS